MNKLTVVFIVIAAAAVIGGGIYLFNSQEDLVTVNYDYTVEMKSSSMWQNKTWGDPPYGTFYMVENFDFESLQSYVKATTTGYKMYNDYGDVIQYITGEGHLVLHRAILKIKYNNDGSWSAPELKDYGGTWSCTSGTDCMNLRGVLTLQGITMSDKTVSIDLDDLRPSTKEGYFYVDGFLTMGDNPVTNFYFDQAAGIANCPIAEDAILGVAVDYRD